MENKTLGTLLVISSVVLLILLVLIRQIVVGAYQSEIDRNVKLEGVCHADEGVCPHESMLQAQVPIFLAGIVLVGVASLGVYIIFFERSQKEIVSALRKQKLMKIKEEKFSLLLRGMDKDEQKVMKAVKEQDGITQQTLRLRTDLHKSKLSIVLDGLEKKGLVRRVLKGKTKQVFLKIRI
ncbi:helix-turn-helix transcriptional regulator [Nanoarchaeota archaeon]